MRPIAISTLRLLTYQYCLFNEYLLGIALSVRSSRIIGLAGTPVRSSGDIKCEISFRRR